MEKEHIKKRLVFYFYTFENFLDNRAIQIHLKCLKHYSKLFDEALFIISVDDTENEMLILNTERELLDIGFKDIRFKVHKNNAYCEAQPFFEEIVCKLKWLDGLTFFGHTKGVTNYQKVDCCVESIDAWILGMYYLNLEFIDEVENSLCYEPHRFFGAFLTDCRNSWFGGWLYSGTFYWLNCPSIWNDVVMKQKEIPTTYHHRGFAEDFPTLLYDWNNGVSGLDSHGKLVVHNFDYYTDTQNRISFLCGGIEGYEDFKNKILSE